MLPHSENVTKLYYLLHLHHVGMVPKTSKNRHFGIPKSILSEPQCTSWLPGVPECPYRAAKKPRCRLSWYLGAKIPGFQVPGIWLSGELLTRARGHLVHLVPFSLFSTAVGNSQNHPKSCFVGFVLPHSQNVTKVYYLLYFHHVGMLPKSSKNQHFCIPNRYL